MIIRREKTDNYSIIANECFKDNSISARAKGIYGYLMTLPDDWKLQKSELYNHFTEGQKAIDTAFKELKEKGYISQTRIKKENGQFSGWAYVVYEFQTPLPNSVKSVETDPAEKAKSDNLPVGNQTLLNTKELNTEIKQKTNKQTNKVEESNLENEKVKDDKSVSRSSISFFDEDVVDKSDRINEIKIDLKKLELSNPQISGLLKTKSNSLELIEQAIYETSKACSDNRISKTPAQYFFGVLNNLENEAF